MNKTVVYVYKEFNDEYAYGEEMINVFSSMKKAKAHLKKQVEDVFGCKFEDVPHDEDDTLSPDYVSVATGDGVMFFIVEEKPIL